MEFYVPSQLLSKNNAKTVKGEKFGWFTYILYLSPEKQNEVGVNNCPQASPGCAAACLNMSGRGSMSMVQKARMNKTHYLKGEREQFLNQLDSEITKHKERHAKRGEKMCIRLNGTSDRTWERTKFKNGKTIFELHPEVQFYDYTKITNRMHINLPSNYHLTFSRSEINQQEIEVVLLMGGNVAVVFDKLPETYLGYKVINGDESDLRFLDGENVVVGLKFKKNTGKGGKENNEEAFSSGFALRVAELTKKQLQGETVKLK